jgi:hypothetical protein
MCPRCPRNFQLMAEIKIIKCKGADEDICDHDNKSQLPRAGRAVM